VQLVSFVSPHYAPLQWVKTLESLYSTPDSEVPLVLSNQEGVLLPQHYLAKTNLQLISVSGYGSIQRKDIKILPHRYLQKCGVIYAKAHVQWSQSSLSGRHFQAQCYRLLHLILAHAQTMLTYTYEHLHQRKTVTGVLSQQSSIQMQLAHSAEYIAMASQIQLEEVLTHGQQALQMIQNALRSLAKLGGGRSMLQGHAVELHYHVELCKSLFFRRASDAISKSY